MTFSPSSFFASFFAFLLILSLTACAGGKLPDDKNDREKRQEKFGKLFGDELLVFGQTNDPQNENFVPSSLAISRVSPLLWLASLKVVNDMPLLQTDKISGIILTDWYQSPEHPQERFKVDISITSSILRSDGVSVKVFRQIRKNNLWQQENVPREIVKAVEDTILNEARKLRTQSQ